MNTINSIITILLFLFLENTLAQNNSSFDVMNGTVPWLNYEILTDCHDPTIIKDDRGIYTMLSTNNMLSVRQSEDMKNWTNQGRIISSLPSWIANVNTETVDIWAPYIYYRDGKYWCYYSISSWGTNNSGIGLLTNTTLEPSSPNYLWEDKGMVFRSYTNNNYNAIDPEVIEDNGRLWMVFGSYWTGIKMIELDY
jgi:arabinan endo-1,5-alpha-L-arabinosidase